MMLDKNLLGGSPSPAANSGSKQRMVEPSTVGTSTSGMKETKLLVSHPRLWYAWWSSSVMVVFLKKSMSSGISPSTIFVVPRVGEEEATIAVLSVSESCLESSAWADVAMRAVGA
jgi:hypothetical protein